MRQLDGPIVALGVGALILIGPLRGVFEAYPLIPFASALFLFMVPGVLVTHWFMGERFPGGRSYPYRSS